jgi:hypothetical protein
MNRRPVGSSVRSSGEGVCVLSCSLLENFLPSDEPTPMHFYTIGSSGAEGILKNSQTHAQLLRRVIFPGRQTIRWWVSPRSRVAPTVRPALSYFHRRFIRRYSEAWFPSVITVRQGFPLTSNPNPSCAAARAVITRTPPSCSTPATPSRTSTCGTLRRPPPSPSAICAALLEDFTHAQGITQLGFGPPPPPIPANLRLRGSQAVP